MVAKFWGERPQLAEVDALTVILVASGLVWERAPLSTGRPSGFSLRFPEVGEDILKKGVPVIYATEFDAKDSTSVLLRLTGDPGNLKGVYRAVLYYGAGLDPYCNIVDEKDMAAPAFGPIALGLAGETVQVHDER